MWLEFVSDLLHLLALICLQTKIWKYRSCAGISGKSNLLYAILLSCRCSHDYFYYAHYNQISMYHTILQIFLLLIDYLTVFLIYGPLKKTCDYKLDRFWATALIIPSAILAYFLPYERTTYGTLWTFSVYLEAVAIWPQFYHVAKVGQVNFFTFLCLLALGLYRGFVVLHWIYIYIRTGEMRRFYLIGIPCGILQFVSYLSFLAYALCKGITLTKEDVPYSTDRNPRNACTIPLSEEHNPNTQLDQSLTHSS